MLGGTSFSRSQAPAYFAMGIKSETWKGRESEVDLHRVDAHERETGSVGQEFQHQHQGEEVWGTPEKEERHKMTLQMSPMYRDRPLRPEHHDEREQRPLRPKGWSWDRESPDFHKPKSHPHNIWPGTSA